MRIIRDLGRLPDAARGAAVALGNFDGLHRGHQAVLARTKEIAGELNAPAAVMTFEPHPREFFTPALAPLTIYSLRTKIELLRGMGIGLLFLQRFNRAFAALEAERFVREVLHEGLGARHIVTGADFTFGRGRGGNAALLTGQAEEWGMDATAVPGVADETGEACSSSRIRRHLKEGDVAGASRLLGRCYTISGRVRKGDARGRELGFPTANMGVGHIYCPAYGVYAVRATTEEGRALPGVANLGIRPTVGGVTPLLEVHCFDFAGDLYGRRLRVKLLHRLRAEKRFESLTALQEAIRADVLEAKKYLGYTAA